MNQSLNCPFCNALLTKKKYCDGCGEDVSLYKKAVAISNAYYNSGLAKAKVRDLSGAAADLRKSLKFYKQNIQARNLLGLVYYEMGDIVNALSEWVLSKNYMPRKNELADFYINDIQNNPTKLENYNQAIKKYNSALASARQDSEDLAIIQLKKVVALNPKFIEAMHLLALLYIKTGEKERAHRILVKASKIDITNTTTLRYLAELGYKNDGPDTVAVSYTNDNNTSSSFASGDIYKEDKPNVMAFVNLIIGVVIGLAVAFFLIVPAVKQDAAQEYSQDTTQNSDQLAKKDSEINALKTENDTLTDKVEELTAQINTLSEQSQDIQNTSDSYASMFSSIQSYMDGDYESAAVTMKDVDLSSISDESMQTIYNTMKTKVVEELKESGHNKYSDGQYEDSLEIYKKIYEIEQNDPDALYFMARSYDKTGDKENAKQYYQYIIDNFPDNKRATEAHTKLDALS